MKFHLYLAPLALLFGSCSSLGSPAVTNSSEKVWVVEATGGA